MNSGCFNGTDDEDERNHDDTGDEIMAIISSGRVLKLPKMEL